MRRLLFLLFALLGAGCVTTGPYVAPEARTAPPLPEGEVAHTVYLTGNTGDLATEAVLRALADGCLWCGKWSQKSDRRSHI